MNIRHHENTELLFSDELCQYKLAAGRPRAGTLIQTRIQACQVHSFFASPALQQLVPSPFTNYTFSSTFPSNYTVNTV